MSSDQDPLALDATLQLRADGRNWHAIVGDIYWNGGSAFGGWLNAIAVKAISNHADFRGPVRSIQCPFIKATRQADITISVDLLSRRRHLDFWRITITQLDEMTNSFDIVAGASKQSSIDYMAPMPDAPPPHSGMEIVPMPPPAPLWLSQYEQFLVKGRPFSTNSSPQSLLWIREKAQSDLTIFSLLTMLDAPMPRSFFLADGIGLGSTISMASYLYASEEEITDTARDFILLKCDGASVREGICDARVEAWSPGGVLLAVSNQISIYRDPVAMPDL